MEPSTSTPPVHSAPLILPPSQAHLTTLIILHGRGSTASKFAEPLLSHPVSPPSTAFTPPSSSLQETEKSFRDHLPHTKFVFPTAPRRRARAFNRALIHQWFDSWSLAEPALKPHLQLEGLRETTAYIHALLRAEIEIVGARNVVLMGLSQGCASSLVAGLLWGGEAFGAVVGMCGYLPLREGMLGAMGEGGGEGGEDDVFERGGGGDGEGGTAFEQAVGWLREELQVGGEMELLAERPAMLSTPVFMGHGAEDDKVSCESGKLAADCLSAVGVHVGFQEYEDLGHWYSGDMLRDVVGFLTRLHGDGNFCIEIK